MLKSEAICEESRPLKKMHRNITKTQSDSTQAAGNNNSDHKVLHNSLNVVSSVHSLRIELTILSFIVQCSTV